MAQALTDQSQSQYTVTRNARHHDLCKQLGGAAEGGGWEPNSTADSEKVNGSCTCGVTAAFLCAEGCTLQPETPGVLQGISWICLPA